MKAATAAIIITSIIMLGVFSTLGGDKVRGEKGTGEVHQEMVDPNKYW
jgi:hypothetical protein